MRRAAYLSGYGRGSVWRGGGRLPWLGAGGLQLRRLALRFSGPSISTGNDTAVRRRAMPISPRPRRCRPSCLRSRSIARARGQSRSSPAPICRRRRLFAAAGLPPIRPRRAGACRRRRSQLSGASRASGRACGAARQCPGARVKVAKGDTLSALSRRYGVPVEKIMAANNLPDGRPDRRPGAGHSRRQAGRS